MDQLVFFRITVKTPSAPFTDPSSTNGAHMFNVWSTPSFAFPPSLNPSLVQKKRIKTLVGEWVHPSTPPWDGHLQDSSSSSFFFLGSLSYLYNISFVARIHVIGKSEWRQQFVDRRLTRCCVGRPVSRTPERCKIGPRRLGAPPHPLLCPDRLRRGRILGAKPTEDG